MKVTICPAPIYWTPHQWRIGMRDEWKRLPVGRLFGVKERAFRKVRLTTRLSRPLSERTKRRLKDTMLLLARDGAKE